MALFVLPAELSILLASYLETADLSSLSRTCTRLRNAYLAHVFNAIEWQWNRGDEKLATKVSPCPYLLLRSLMARPSLGHYIEHIGFQKDELRPMSVCDKKRWAPILAPALDSDEICAVERWVDFFGLDAPDSWNWKCALRCGDVDAYVSLILGFAKNLRSLILESSFFHYSFLPGCLFEQALLKPSKDSQNRLPRYEKLREVRMSAIFEAVASDRSKLLWSDMHAALYLPAIQYLTIPISPPHEFCWPITDQNGASIIQSLTSLELSACTVAETVLERLLSVKPPLKNLKVKFISSKGTDLNLPRFDVNSVSRALYSVHYTLESLVLCIKCEELNPDTLVGGLTRFIDFPRLTNLALPSSMVTVRQLSSLLPPCIHELVLTDDSYSAGFVEDWTKLPEIEQVEDLISEQRASKSELFPHLRQVQRKAINGWTTYWDQNETTGEYFRRAVMWYPDD